MGHLCVAELVAVCVFLYKEEAQKHAYSLRGDGEIRTLVYLDTFGGKQFLFRAHFYSLHILVTCSLGSYSVKVFLVCG